MKTLLEHIENVRGKPHHVRTRVAFTSAAAVTALIAIVWLSVSVGTGAFAIRGSSFADAEGQQNTVTADSGNQNASVAGAVSALPSQDTNAPAHIEIVDTSPAKAQKKAEQTVIPF